MAFIAATSCASELTVVSASVKVQTSFATTVTALMAYQNGNRVIVVFIVIATH